MKKRHFSCYQCFKVKFYCRERQRDKLSKDKRLLGGKQKLKFYLLLKLKCWWTKQFTNYLSFSSAVMTDFFSFSLACSSSNSLTSTKVFAFIRASFFPNNFWPFSLIFLYPLIFFLKSWQGCIPFLMKMKTSSKDCNKIKNNFKKTVYNLGI